MATTITDETQTTDEQAREALRSLIQQLEESRERIKAYDEQMARSRAERDEMKAETRASLARIQKILDRF
jgi:Spy/CpxP family protein refolding chaperone